MENILDYEQVITKSELISYFSVEILCFIGIIVNFISFLLLRKKFDIKRVSDFVTLGTLIIGFIINICIYFKNKLTFDNAGFTLFNDIILFDNQTILYKTLINLFFILFMFCVYKITRKTRQKIVLINSTLLTLAPFCYILAQIQKPLISFILLEFCTILIYKYASNMRIRKEEIYSPSFILVNSLSSIIFYFSYFLTGFIKIDTQIAFAQIITTMAILLKIGIFPIYNYSLNCYFKNNIPYSILLFCLLPLLGTFTFISFTPQIDFSNNAYIITMTLFLSLTIFASAINAFKIKNLIKFATYISQIFFALNIIGILFFEDKILSLNTILYSIFTILGFYSLLCILKINLKPEKLNILTLKGLTYKNRLFSIILMLLLLILTNIVPSKLFIQNLDVLKEIYLFDEIGTYVVCIAILANTLVLLNSIKIIKILYLKPSSLAAITLTKRTMLNYIVPIAIILFLLIKIFL